MDPFTNKPNQKTAPQNMNTPQRIEGLTKANARQLMQLVDMVVEDSGLTARAIYGPDQDQFSVSFRRALWWCLREGYGMTYAQIAKLFLNRDGKQFNHSSIISGCNAVREEGMLVFSQEKGKWVAPPGQAVTVNPRLRQALQIAATAWNQLNPQNQLQTWTDKNSQ